MQYAANAGGANVQDAANTGGSGVQKAANTGGAAATSAAAQEETPGGANTAAANAANTNGVAAPHPFPPPPGEGIVRGRVLHAERKLGIADLEVALYAFAAERVLGLARTRSGTDGRFQFAKISADPALSYLVGVRYQGVAHPGTRVRFAAGEREVEALVRVNELTDSASAIEVSALDLRVAREVGRLRIHQEVELQNTGARSFYLPAPRRDLQKPGEAAYHTRLPKGAFDFRMPLGVTPEGLLQQAGRIAWFGPVHPGRHRFSFSYALPTKRLAEGARGVHGDAAMPGERGAASAAAHGDTADAGDVGAASAAAHGDTTDTSDAGAASAAAHGDTGDAGAASAAAQQSAPVSEALRFELRVPVDVPLTLLTPLQLGRVDAPDFSVASGTARLLQGEHTRTLGRSGDGRITLAFELPPARRGGDAALLREIQVVLNVDDAATRVNENIALEITSGTLALADREQPFFHLELPPGAEDLRFAAEAPGMAWLPHPGGGLALVGAAHAGSYEMQVQYRLAAAAAAPLRIRRSFEKALPLLSFFVADSGDLQLEAERLHRRRPLRSNDRNYLRLEAFELTPGEVIDLAIQRRPSAAFARGDAARVMALLLALGSVLYLALPLRRGARSLARAPAESAAARERAALIATIRDLDHDLETGKLSAEDHAKWRGEMFEQAAALLAREREERAFFARGATARETATRNSPAQGDAREAATRNSPAQGDASEAARAQAQPGAASPAAARQAAGARQEHARHCPRCAAPAESEAHRFCAWCGAPLPETPRTPDVSRAGAADAQEATNKPGTPDAPDAPGSTNTLADLNTEKLTNPTTIQEAPGAPDTPSPTTMPRTPDGSDGRS